MIGDKVAPDSNLFTIKSKNKTIFANEKIKELDVNEFDKFEILFDKIKDIIEK